MLEIYSMIAFLIPIYPPHYPFIYKLIDKVNTEGFYKMDFFLVFSNQDDYDEFEYKEYIKHIIVPSDKIINTNAHVPFKKFYALNYLKDNTQYDYFISCDAEIDIILENFTSDNIKNKIDAIFNNKKIYGGYTEHSDIHKITESTATIFNNDADIVKIKENTSNYRLFYWWSDLPVYKQSHLNDFFLKINYNNLTWYHFDHMVYLNFLFLYHNFQIINVTNTLNVRWSLENFETDDIKDLDILKNNLDYTFSWVNPSLYQKHKEYLIKNGSFIIFHLDRWNDESIDKTEKELVINKLSHSKSTYYSGISSLYIKSNSDYCFSKFKMDTYKLFQWCGHLVVPKSVKTIMKFDIMFLSDVPTQSDNFAVKSHHPEIHYKEWLAKCKKNQFVHIEIPMFLTKNEQFIIFIADNYLPELSFHVKNIEFCYEDEKINNEEKVALVYRGHYKRNSSAWSKKGNGYDIDILQNHLDSIRSRGIKHIDIYFHSYSINDEEDYKLLKLLSDYNLVNFSLTKDEKFERAYSVINSLKIVEDKYKFVMNTRFDLYFMKQLKYFNIVDEKFNICFKDHEEYWISEKKTSDLLWIIPYRYIHNLINAANETSKYDPMSLHLIVNHLNLDESELNFMIDGYFTSNTDVEDNFFDINKDSLQNNFIYLKRK